MHSQPDRLKCSSSEREAREQERLIGWIRDHGDRVTVRDLAKGPRLYRPEGAAEKALQAFVEIRKGRWENVPATMKGGRPTRVFVLNRSDDGDKTSKDGAKTEVSEPPPPDAEITPNSNEQPDEEIVECRV